MCRSGCKSKDHGSYAECLQAANVTVSALAVSPFKSAYEKTQQDLRAYATARANGIQPTGTTVEAVRQAEAASKHLGRAYDANTMPPAKFITSKKTAQFVGSE